MKWSSLIIVDTQTQTKKINNMEKAAKENENNANIN